MSETPPAAPPSPGTPSPALIDAELARLAASRPFRRSPRHVRFLRHLVDAALGGNAAQRREIVIGVEVFLRSATHFDPRRDTIVRVEARRLRAKLAAYYADEGLDARLEFRLSPRGYEVEIERRDSGGGPRLSVAVFPLVLHADAEGLAALAASLHAELAALLTRLNGLRVLAAAAAADADAERQAAQRLHADHHVGGRLASAGGQLLLELQLTQVLDGRVLWSRRGLVDPAQALHALEAPARAIVSTLHREAAQRRLRRIALAGSRPYVRALADGGPTADGLDAMGLARIAMRHNSLDGYRKAALLAERATALMPRHAAAFALLADALLALVGATAVPPLPTLHAARRAAETAVELDAENADGHGQLGQLLLVHQRDWAAAEPRMLESLRLAPGLASAHARYGWALMMNARYAEARACYAEARDLDPLSLLYRVHEALIAYYERDWPRAAAGFDAVLDVAPQHLFALALRAATALAAGDAADALERYRQLTALAPRLSIGRCGAAQAQALLGDRRAARRELTRLHALERDGFVSPYQVAMVLARLGDANGTLRALQQAADVADFNLVCAGVDPAFDALRGTPGFAALLARSGMAHLAAH